MLKFIRSDLATLSAYPPNPGGKVPHAVDRLDANESPYDLPPELKEKLARAYLHHLETNRYPDGSHFALKEEIAEYVNSYSADLNGVITPDEISIGNGSDELIRSILIATCLGKEGSISIANPTFSMYAILAETLGIEVVNLARCETDFSIDLLAAQKTIASAGTPPIRVVFVVHPNSPTGNALNAAELEWLRSLKEEILVVIDEAYFEFSQTSVVNELRQHPNWIILRTFSKALRLASLRIGYAIAHRELIDVLEKIRLPYNLPGFTQMAASIALNNRETLLPSIAETLKERDRIYDILSRHPKIRIWPSRANFFYARLKTATEENSHRLLSHLTRTLKDRGTSIRHTGGGLRITIGTPDENARTIERLQMLLDDL